MDAKFVGLHEVKATLKSGERKTYYYAWRGGPRIKAKPGTNAFVQEFARLTRDRDKERKAKEETLGWLNEQYLASADYQSLKPKTRHDYQRIIGVLKVKWGSLPLLALETKGARTLFVNWRDEMRDTPRSADMHIEVLPLILACGKDLEYVLRDRLERVEKHHNASRKDDVGLAGQIDRILPEGAPQVANLVKVALWT